MNRSPWILPVALCLAAAPGPGERRVAAGWTAAESVDYRAAIDRNTRYGGHPSLSIEFAGANASGYAVTQSVKADAYRGRRIRLTGYVKVDQAVDGGALWLRVDFANGDYVLDNSLDLSPADRSPRDAAGWTKCQIVAVVPHDALGISFGLRMKGKGKIHTAGLRFDTVAATVPATTIERRGYKAQPGKDAAIVQLQRQFANAPRQPVNLDFEQP